MRQAGLSQIPFSMGTPVQQAGLSGPPAAPGGAAAATPAGLAAPAAITMADRSALVAEMAGQGMSFAQIQAQLAALGIIAPTETPEDMVEAEATGIGDVLRQGARQQLGMAMSGAGLVAERTFGQEGATDAATAAADAALGLTPEEQEARALRAEDQSIWGEIGDAAVGSLPLTGAMLGGGVIGGWLGGIAGSAFGPAGTIGGAMAGRRLGAYVGTLLPAIPTMIGSALERAKEHGHDLSDPEVQNTVMATGAARAVLETFGIERLGSVLMGPATTAAKRSLAKAAVRGGTQFAAIEAAAEAAGEILEIAVFDPKVREQLSEGEYAKLVEYAQEKYGRDILVGSAAGALVGGGIGAPGSTWQQNKINAQRTQDIETLAGVAEEGGVGREALEAAAQDPAQVPALAQAARELGAARREIQQAQTVIDAVADNPDADLRTQAEARYREAVAKADETYDRVMKPFGAMTSQQIETRKEQAAQRAREVLVEKELATPDAVESMSRQEVGALASELANAEARAEAANEALRGGDMFETAKREAAQRELVAAENDLQRTKDNIAIKTGKATPESIKADAKRRAEQKQYDEAVDRQYSRKFEPLMARDPEAAAAEAERIIAVNKSDEDKGLNTAIRKLETKLDKAQSVDEINKIEAEIADKRSRLGRQPPIVAAARRVLDSVGPRQGGEAAQGTSPAAARQSPEPEATTAVATPDAPPTAPASAPETAQGQTPATPAVQTPDATQTGDPAGAVNQPDAVPPEQQATALDRVRQKNADKEVGAPEDVRMAAPTILDMGVTERQRLGLPADATPTEARNAGGSLDLLRLERDLAYMSGLPIDATPAQMRQKVEDPATIYQIPDPATDMARTEAAAQASRTRQQARAEGQADADAAATQARLDREYQQSPAPDFAPATRVATGTPNYTDMMDVFGRRSATPKQARTFVQEQGAKTGHEYIVAIDRETGEVLGAGTNNRENLVFPSDAAINALKLGRAVDFIHNHPRGTTLSGSDIAFMYEFPGAARVTAVAPDGSTYTAEPTGAGREAFGKNAKKHIRNLTTLGVSGDTLADRLYRNTLEGWVREGVVQPDAAGFVSEADRDATARGVRRAINRALSQEGLMKYTEAGPRELVSSREQNAYDRGVRNARKTIRDTYAVPAAARSDQAGARSGNVQRSGAVRSRRPQAGRRQGRDQSDDGSGLAEPDGSDPRLSRVAAGRRDGGERSTVSRAPRSGETVAGLTPSRVYEATNGTTIYEVAAPQDFTRQAEAAIAAIGPVGAQVGTDPGGRQFLMHDGKAGFALDGDNLISLFTAGDAPSGVMSAAMELGIDEGARRLDAFDTFLPQAYARRGFRAVARLPFNREFAPEGWDYGFFNDTFGVSDPDVVFMVYDPANATPDTDNVISDYDGGAVAQQAALEAGGMAEDASLPPIDVAEVRRGQGAGRQHATWHDFSAQLPETLTPDEAAAEVSRRGQDGFEYAVFTRDDGSVLGAGTNRARNAVATSDAAAEYFRNDIAPISLVHNHPIPSPLSWGDMQMVVTSQSPLTMTAVLPDGARETAKLTDAARALPWADRVDALHRAEEKVYSVLRGEGAQGAIQRAAALNRALAQAGVIEYTPGLPDPSGPRVKEAIDAAVAEVLDTYPALRDAGRDGRSQEPGGSPTDAEATVGPEAIRSIRSASDLAIANARPDREIVGKAAPSQYPDPIMQALDGPLDVDPAAMKAFEGLQDRLRANRAAFKAARPDLHPLTLDSTGEPIVFFHGTTTPGFDTFNPDTRGIFTARQLETAVTYSKDFATDLSEKLVRFRTEPATLEQTLTSPEVAEAFGVDIRKAGSVVNPQYFFGDPRLPEGSPWRDILFPEGGSNVALSDQQIERMQTELGLTDADIADMRPEPWYDARYRSRTPVADQAGQPVVDIPHPTAQDLVRRMMVDRAARKIRSDAMSTEPGAYLKGKAYPLFVDMVNPLVVDYRGNNWDDAPHTLARATVAIPQSTDPFTDRTKYEFVQMDFDYADYGGPEGARAAAQQRAEQTRDDMYGPTTAARERMTDPTGFAPEASVQVEGRALFPTTNAWAAHAHRQGHDGVVFRDIRDSGSIEAPIDDVFVVFNPQQLKHALDNEGTYRRDDPNMLAEDQSVPAFQETVNQFKASEARAKKALEPPAWLDVKTQQGSAIQAAIDIAKTPGVITKFASFVETQLINQLAPIRNYKLRKDGALDIGMNDMFKAAEVAVNDPGRNEALLYYGAAKLGPDGSFRVAEGTIGLHTMLKKLPDGKAVMDWMEYMGARRAQEVRAKGLETPLTDADIAAGLAKESPLFKEVAADWKKFNDANVDFLVDTGRISKALATTLKQDAAYIPFYRSEETLQGIHDLMDDTQIRKAAISRRGGAVLARDPGIKKMTGGKTRQINNLIENMIKNSQAMIGAGMRNRAANLSFDIMQDAGDVALTPARRKTAEGDYVNVTAPKNAVRMWKDGGEYFITPQTSEAIPVLAALAGMQPVRLGGIHKAMAAVGSFFRQSITLSPSFIVRNMIRDAVSTGVLFQGKNLTMENNMFKGFVSSLRHSASRQAFSAQSGMGDFRFGGTDIGLGKNDLLIELGVMQPTKLGQLGYQFRRAVNAMEALGTASELSNRVATYDALIQNGVRPDEAAYQALTITNYSRKGANSQLQMLLPLVPFLNARIQGLSRVWEDATTKRGKDRQQALAKLATSGAILAAASALLWGWNNGDEERREEYQAEPLHRRLNYHIIYAGERKFMIPKAFEVGTLFGTVPELIMQAAVNKDTSELGAATVMTLTNTLSFNPIPQAILPALELMTDYNFFTGRPIEGQRLSALMREDRINPQTSALAAGLARSGLGSFTGLSPVQMDHLLSGYGGVAYSSLATMIDTAGGEMGLLPERASTVFGDIPIVNTALENTFRSMFKQRDADPANKWVEDFYQTRAAITQIYRSARAAALTGDVERARQLLVNAKATPAAYKLVNRAGSQLSDINSAIRQVQASTDLTGAQKRQQLDKLIAARNKLSSEVMKIIREQEELQGATFKRAAR